MRSYLPKLIFIAVLVGAAFLARAGYRSGAESSASVVGVVQGDRGDAASAAAGVSSVALTDAGGSAAITVASSTTGAIAGASPFVRTGDAPAPALDYREALVADLESGTVLFGDHDGDRWPLASVTKLMTAVVATETLGPAQTITVTPAMMAADPTDATLKVGDTYTVADLLKIMLLKSSNVAAEALAGMSGRTQFLAAMNAHAAALGMHDTFYYDPSGLSSTNQSTADDLVRIAQAIDAKYPQIFAITRTPQATVTNLAAGRKLVIKSINDFAGQPGFIGGKTGYTDLADGNLLSIFKYENRPVLVIIMGTDESQRFDNTTALYNWFKQNFR